MENVLESWAEIAITVKTEDIETAGNIANMVVPYGIYIEDYSALEEDAAEISHYDFIQAPFLVRVLPHGHHDPGHLPPETKEGGRRLWRRKPKRLQNCLKSWPTSTAC